MSDYIQANSCGRLHDARLPSVSPLDRGFLYGDGIYEVWRSYNGVLFAFDEHWARLDRSAAAIGLSTGLTRSDLIAEIQKTATEFRRIAGHDGEIYVRLQVSRGAGPIGLDVALADKAFWTILVQPVRAVRPAAGRTGMHLHVARGLFRNPVGALNPAWKTGNYLNNLLCLREARSAGADEVVILNQHGAVCEAAVCNIFFVRGVTLVTPPLTTGILEGITRDLLLREIAPRAGIATAEETIMPDCVGDFGECFLSSSTRDVCPVERIDDVHFATGDATMSARLKAGFGAFADAYSAAHPELKV